MQLIDVTDESFRELYKNNDIIVLDFWAIWCGPCHQFAPIFESVAKQYPDIVFGKVETENNLELSKYFTVMSIPTILIIREGLELFRHSGVLGEDELVNVIEQVKSADMNEVNRQIEAEENQS